jgi:hypothetical protein
MLVLRLAVTVTGRENFPLKPHCLSTLGSLYHSVPRGAAGSTLHYNSHRAKNAFDVISFPKKSLRVNLK